MDPTTQKVNITLEDGPTATYLDDYRRRRVWGLAFPDLADTAYYAESDPITQMADYSISYGGTIDDDDFRQTLFQCTLPNARQPITEALLPNDGATCAAELGTNGEVGSNWRKCWIDLPNRNEITHNITTNAGTRLYEFEVDFKSCGYEFNPYEFQTCRPLTMTLMAGVDTLETCLFKLAGNGHYIGEAAYGNQTFFQHYTDKIQIDDFPTRSPTFSPTFAPTMSPSSSPSLTPTLAPTSAPVSPTVSPTFPTNAPTDSPSKAPTPKPTDLPTANLTIYDKPDCEGLYVRHLDVLFEKEQSAEEFNQVFVNATSREPLINNQRRVWSNGELDIYFTDRFESVGGGDWVITNGSYSAISIVDANFNNSLFAPHSNSLPGPFPFGYVYFDHFPHDNILSKPDEEVTLFFACNNTQFPTSDPTPSPTTAIPTMTPTTSVPTSAPTANCTALCMNPVSNGDCGVLTDYFDGCFLKTDDENDRAKWEGIAEVTSYSVYYSILYEKWIINGNDGYSASIEGTSLYPPQSGIWEIFDSFNPYNIDCTARFNYVCSGTQIPTKTPTLSPTTLVPTTSSPTQAPSLAPTLTPSTSPSSTPSAAPSLAPTSSPIDDCAGFNLTGTDLMDGLYARNPNQLISGRNYWEKVRNGDAKIYWSDSVFHETWIIQSEQNERFWVSESKPNLSPQLNGNKWSLYFGASPIVIESRSLTLECFDTPPPTPSPTDSPSFSPTLAPSIAPTLSPSNAPSAAPSLAPSSLPSESPTSKSPTTEPTLDPTQEPTMEPTPESCPYLIVSNVGNYDAVIGEFEGVYFYQNVEIVDEWKKNESDNGNVYELSNNGNDLWQIEEINNANVVTSRLQVIGLSDYRPPYLSNKWQIDGISDTNYSLSIECADTDAPTSAPSVAPSLAPTGSPTSSCLGLYFNNTDDANFTFNGWYRRDFDYLWNGRTHWKSVDGKAEIRFIGTSTLGQWVLSEFDSDNGDDEDPIMLTQNGQNLLSPPSGEWKYIDTNLNNASVIILCDATFAPSADPTLSPSQMPTEYVMPNWSFCPNDRTYFSFDSSSVYWPLPVLDNDHLNVTVTPNVVPGQNNFTRSKHEISYKAIDSANGAETECIVTVYVIGGDKVNYEYCKEQKFHINVQFNDSYIEISGIDEESAQGTEVANGKIIDPMLISDGTTCYVTAEKVSIYQKVEIDDGPASTTILGFELANYLWEILIAILIFLLLCLIADCLWRKCKKDKKTEGDAEQTESLLANEINQNEEKNDIELQQANNEEIKKLGTGSEAAEKYDM